MIDCACIVKAATSPVNRTPLARAYRGIFFSNVSLDILLKSVLHNSPDSRLRIHCGEQFVAQQSAIGGLPQSTAYTRW